ncbi:MAG TPA: acylphosphatase [candidate division WOR-3 bacterium]|uniref:acylphosphatase n=1 Tax=candidate division WOR-3 bacterium TaxID=2052148 RepID=A0A9C9ENT4_UNCW3|nr:acylphosphatase [candidate division WOR-3 bacterium]
MKALIIIQGLVQGVGYRFFTVEQAKRFNIRGYVKNLPDGSVEVIAEGEEKNINDFIEQLKIGPASAQVTDVEVKWEDVEFGFSDFDIRY